VPLQEPATGSRTRTSTSISTNSGKSLRLIFLHWCLFSREHSLPPPEGVARVEHLLAASARKERGLRRRGGRPHLSNVTSPPYSAEVGHNGGMRDRMSLFGLNHASSPPACCASWSPRRRRMRGHPRPPSRPVRSRRRTGAFTRASGPSGRSWRRMGRPSTATSGLARTGRFAPVRRGPSAWT
jgi:hypothetical protein